MAKMADTQQRTLRPEPTRFRLAREFIEAAKDAGDPAMTAVARRVWWAISFPRTRPCSSEDMQIFHDWCDAA